MATGVSKTKWQASGETTTPVFSSGISLTYADKADEGKILETDPATLSRVWSAKPCASNSLYFGDNLPVLAALLKQKELRGKVKLIYIDPPYATNSVFQSRTQNDAYQDLLTGASYVEFLRKRLVLLRELLAEEGSIYVHLDDKMAHYIKVAMDEVFGVQNFRNWITRRKCSHKNYTKKTYGNISDYILFYTKSDAYTWNRPIEEWTPERAKKRIPLRRPGIRQAIQKSAYPCAGNAQWGNRQNVARDAAAARQALAIHAANLRGNGHAGRNILVANGQSSSDRLSGKQ